MKKPLGVVLYEGPSLIDGKPIVVIANGFQKKGKNGKIGDMLQCWILRSDIAPLDASSCGDDYSICGSCVNRHFRSCYVNLAHGPSHVYDAYKRGRYNEYNGDILELFRDKQVRLGAYGDPASTPFHIWESICSVAYRTTGYTHSWRTCEPALKEFCMASVDTIREKNTAVARGWRTFRVRLEEEEVKSDEIMCPASKEAGVKSDCSKCNGCNGLSSKMKKNVSIIVHGISWKVLYYKIGIKKYKNKKKYAREYATV
jgi:hypothetical protein